LRSFRRNYRINRKYHKRAQGFEEKSQPGIISHLDAFREYNKRVAWKSRT